MRSDIFVLGLLGVVAMGCGAVEPAQEVRAEIVETNAMVQGKTITAWTEAWWHWTFGVPADQDPELVLEQDCAVGQDESVFFVPAYDGATKYQRTCVIPRGKPVLVPLWVVINDYPCPDPAFEPSAGQSLEEFLREGAMGYNDAVQNLVVTVDGETVEAKTHRHTTGLIEFTAEKTLVGALPDPCLTGMKQSGVSDGFWLMVNVAGGSHDVHVAGLNPSGEAIDYTYVLSGSP